MFNSHLAYDGQLNRAVGPTRVLGRNAKFTVTVSTRRDAMRPGNGPAQPLVV
ncbi:MAG: hypothetical protein IMZ75_07860 [Actinobacteria bacterium]|nr:hypothetical protein [Actinomycetota bacterium]